MTASSPAPRAAFPAVPARPPSASTAGTMVLLAICFQVLGVLLVFSVLYVFVGPWIFNPFAYSWSWAAATAIISVFAGVILLIVFAFFFSYRRIDRGDYAGAQTPTLVLGVLSILTLNIISGALFLIGYAKLGDALREQQSAATSAGVQPVAFASSLVACKGCGRVFPLGAFSFCPNCGQKLGG